MREAVLWGQHVDEYQRMFSLTDSDFDSQLLEYCSGVTAVNAELHARHQSMISCDPWFSLDKDMLLKKVTANFEASICEVKAARSRYNFIDDEHFEGLIERRREGIAQCLADYEKGREEKRYLPMNNDLLPFEDFSFDLALSSYFFFAGTESQDEAFHLQRIRELTRVAKEVRIFPLIDREGQPSHLLGPVLLGLQQSNYGVEIREVNDHLQKGSHAMLRVWARECPV